MLKHSILKRPTTAYLSVEENNQDVDRQNGGMSLKFSPANSTQNSQKNVRFSGIEFKQYNNSTTSNVVTGIPPKPQLRQSRPQQQQLQSSTAQFETNKDDYFELNDKTQFPNEIGIKKYYKKSKTVPCKQIKLVGLNDEFIVASQPIQRHIQRELIAQQNQLQKEQQQQQQRPTTANKTRSQLRTTSARPFNDNYNRSLMYPNVFSTLIRYFIK